LQCLSAYTIPHCYCAIATQHVSEWTAQLQNLNAEYHQSLLQDKALADNLELHVEYLGFDLTLGDGIRPEQGAKEAAEVRLSILNSSDQGWYCITLVAPQGELEESAST
jgi:hypothetical protein